MEDLDKALKFSIEVEEKKDFSKITNYEEVGFAYGLVAISK
jgi:hypothetical protein